MDDGPTKCRPLYYVATNVPKESPQIPKDHPARVNVLNNEREELSSEESESSNESKEIYSSNTPEISNGQTYSNMNREMLEFISPSGHNKHTPQFRSK